MPQVHEVGQSCPAVGHDGVGDFDHRQERDRAFLHSGTARGGTRQQRQPFERRTFDRVDEPLGRGHADRTGEETEFAGDDGNATTLDPPLSGDDGFVDSGLLLSGGEFGRVLVGDSSGGCDRSRVPGHEGSVVHDDVDEFMSIQPCHVRISCFRCV